MATSQETGGTAEEMKASLATALPNDDQLSKPIFKNGRYENPWKTWKKFTFASFLKFAVLTKNKSDVPSTQELDKTLPIMKPDVREFDRPLPSGVRLMWVGHATVVAQVDGVTVMTDPVFSQRASMVKWVGPKRFRDPPCTVQQLPKIDAVVISHNHYDHLDYDTVVALNRRFGRSLRWFVPMGLRKWMADAGCESVVEMSWWEEHEVEGSMGVRVACTPCQHWSKRTATDDNRVLWSSWCVLGPTHSFHFSGDTGYCQGFREIGRKYGPFTAAAIPIGAYHPRWFMSPQHVDPAQAVDIHQDVRSNHSIGIHWGTFTLTYEHYLEPRELLRKEVESRQMRPDAFITVRHGEITIVGADDYDKVD